MDFKRKELAKNAKKNLKKHYWLLVAVCLFAAFIGSEFTETMEAFKSLGTVNNEIQGAASVSYTHLDVYKRQVKCIIPKKCKQSTFHSIRI